MRAYRDEICSCLRIIVALQANAAAVRKIIGVIDVTTSHLTRLSKNDSQVIGYGAWNAPYNISLLIEQ